MSITPFSHFSLIDADAFQLVLVFTLYTCTVLKHLSRFAFVTSETLEGYFQSHEFPPHLRPPQADT